MSGKVVRAAVVGAAVAWASLTGLLEPGGVRVACAADDAPDAEAIRRASKEFDAGRRAYQDEQWELAASHFEAADEAVPSERALRMAMRSRQKAGQTARAATLAAAALGRYDDPKTTDLAQELVDGATGLHRIDVTCAVPCVLAVGTRAVPGAAKEAWTVFVDPGDVKVSASFEGDRGSVVEQVAAAAGGTSSFDLKPEAETAPEPVAEPEPEPEPVLPGEPAVDEDAEGGGAVPQAVFWVGLVATAGLGGVTIWSGVDTMQDPGEDVVRTECRGLGTDCAAYQRGLEKQLRTNVLIGVTAGLGVVTGVVAAFTDWGGGEEEGVGDTAFRLGPGPGEVGLGLEGTF